MLDSEKLDLRNQLERIKLNYDDLTRRYNDLSTEAQSRVRLQEHLSQTGELKRYIIFLFRLFSIGLLFENLITWTWKFSTFQGFSITD